MSGRSVEWERMLAGELYNPMDEMLVRERLRSQRLCRELNTLDPEQPARRRELLAELLLEFGERSEIISPFYCDYGSHIRMGAGAFMNFNCVVLDCSWVTIGDRTLIGPAVQIYAATHPLDPAVRAQGVENAKPVTVGPDVWIGGGAILCPGVSIGAGTTIGAGSVVTRDIPARVFAAGNPCRVIRSLEQPV